MILWDMSVMGALMVGAVLAVRAVCGQKVSGQIFLIFWMAAAARFLIPVQLPLDLLNVSSGLEAAVSRAEEACGQWAEEVGSGVREGQEKEGNPILIQSGSEQRRDPSGRPEMRTGSRKISWEEMDFLIWAAGAASVGACFLIRYIRHIRKLREALPAEDWEAVKKWREQYPRSGTKGIRVFYTDYYDVPFSRGIFRPGIVLAKGMRTISPEKMEYILEHEAVHLRRRDGLWKLAGILVACVHWFNPLAWVMLGKLDEDLEISCDELVTRGYGTEARKQYAETLLAMEQGGRPPFLINGFGGKRMKRRIRRVLREKYSRSLSAAVLVLVGVLLAGCMGGEKGITSEAQESGSADEKEAMARQIAEWLVPGTEITVSYGSVDRVWVMTEETAKETYQALLMPITHVSFGNKGSNYGSILQKDGFGLLCGDGGEEMAFSKNMELQIEMKEPQPFAVGCIQIGGEDSLFSRNVYKDIYRLEERPQKAQMTVPVEFPAPGMYYVCIRNLGEEELKFGEIFLDLGQPGV